MLAFAFVSVPIHYDEQLIDVWTEIYVKSNREYLDTAAVENAIFVDWTRVDNCLPPEERSLVRGSARA